MLFVINKEDQYYRRFFLSCFFSAPEGACSFTMHVPSNVPAIPPPDGILLTFAWVNPSLTIIAVSRRSVPAFIYFVYLHIVLFCGLVTCVLYFKMSCAYCCHLMCICCTVCVLLFLLCMPDCWLEDSIPKALRPATSIQVFLGFPVSISKRSDGSQHSKLPLHAPHVALPT